jgi:nucleotide-binding universal stress UspA family protein
MTPPNHGPEQHAEAPRGLVDLGFRRLLVAIDGSESSELALSLAVIAAQRDNAALTLISVAPDVIAETARWPGGAAAPRSLQDEVDAAARQTLEDAVGRLPKEIPVTTILRRGKAGPKIVEAAREGDYDVIMLGARGVGRVGALIGSVSHHVLHHADIAVFVAHGARERNQAG